MTEVVARTEAAPSWRLCRACGLADGSDYSCYCCMPQATEPPDAAEPEPAALSAPDSQRELDRIDVYLRELQLRDTELYTEFAPVCERSLIMDLKRGQGSCSFKLVGRNTKDGRLHYYMPRGAPISKISDVQRELHRLCSELGYRLVETQRVERTRKRVVDSGDDFMWFRHIQKFYVFFCHAAE